jgi:hypothetical protein
MVSHVVVAALAVVYFCGFVILFVYDNSYGIVEFGLFRSKVVVVGGLFGLMLAVSFVATSRLAGMFGLRTKASEWQQGIQTNEPTLADDSPPTFLGIVPSIIFSQLLLASLFSLILDSPFRSAPRALVSCVVCFAAGSLILMYKKGLRRLAPWLPTSLLWVAVLFLAFFLNRYSSSSFLYLVAWLSLITAFTIGMVYALAKTLKTFEWEKNVVLGLILLLGIFALKIFPDIKTQFGGGAAPVVLIHLAKRVPPFASDSIRVSLIDETERGYYVDPGNKRAVFIPRELVEGIQY